MDRRFFLRNSALLTAGVTAVPGMTLLAAGTPQQTFQKIRFGICTDLHHDIMPDGLERLDAFVADMNNKKADFIIQMGDFCRLYEHNRPLLTVFDKFNGPKYHVIGNHDTDGGFNRDQVVKFWNAIAKYYSFDNNGYHFVVLDANEVIGEPNPNRKYPSNLTIEQLEWLEKDLDNAKLPVIIFIHQSLDNDEGVENAANVRHVLEAANKKSSTKKVLLVFSGHHHEDYMNTINGIHYIQINSMSNHFLGKKYMAPSYSKEILDKIPKLLEVTPYKDPLWATVDIDTHGVLTLTGRKSEYVGPSPEKRGVPRLNDFNITPYISDRKIDLKSNC